MEETKSSNGIESIGLQRPTVNHDLNRGGAKLLMLQKESTPTTQGRTATMGTDHDSGLPEHLRQQRNENTDSHCYGLDRYSWNQGQNAKFDFQIFEDVEPGIVARGGAAVAYAIKKG